MYALLHTYDGHYDMYCDEDTYMENIKYIYHDNAPHVNWFIQNMRIYRLHHARMNASVKYKDTPHFQRALCVSIY